MTPLALFTATRFEFSAVCRALDERQHLRRQGRPWAQGRRGRTDVLVVRTGVGPGRAGRAATEVLEARPVRAVLSIGFGGALTTARVGDLLIATEVASRADEKPPVDSPVRCASPLVDLAGLIAQDAGWGVLAGRLVTMPAVVVSAIEKARLGRETGAIGVDMESGAIGAVAAGQGIPFLSVRAVSDLVDEDLPDAFNGMLTPGGRARAALDLILRPSNWVALNRLRRHTRVAGERLTAFTAAFLERIA